MSGSLIVAGSGIKFISHLTTEAKAYIEQSDKVLYLVNEPAMKEWIQKTNPNAESLDTIYKKHPLRLHCYREITNYIVENLKKNLHVCVVLYGHPTVFARPALDAVLLAREQGYSAKILPGISAEDALFSDLAIDPGSCGCQSYEATDLLLYSRKIDTRSHVVLWQVGCIGILGNSTSKKNTKGVELLLVYLSQYYSVDHEVIVYEAAQYPYFEPRIDKLPLNQITKTKLSSISMLYIPPAHASKINIEMLNALNINIDDLQ